MWHNGWDGDIDSLERGRKLPSQVQKEMLDADTVVFHRADTLDHHKTAVILKKAGKKIVFDNDDTFKMDDNRYFKNMDKKNYKKNHKIKNMCIDSFVRNVDLVTTTTEFLADEYRKLNKNVVVIPNCVDPMDWDEPKRNEGDKVRIGIVGSVAYYNDFEVIQEYLKELSERKDITLVLFGLHSKKTQSDNPLLTGLLNKEYDFWNGIDIEQAPWVEMSEYMSTLNSLKLDIMLIPRKDNYFNRCKSNIKFLEAAMCEIPVIASGFKDGQGCYDFDLGEENNQHGIFGRLAYNEKEWREEVELLIEDKNKRRAIGRNARNYAECNYNIEHNAHKWEEAYKTLT
jgi:glycosyltransferase involved in cell wall biosynthesis